MENRFQRIFLGIAGTLLCGAALAQDDGPVQVIEPDIERREIVTPRIDTENIEIGAYYGVISIEDFSSNEVAGIRLAYHITEDIFIEGTYGQSSGDTTTFEELSGGAQLLSDEDRDFTYYDLSLGYNIFPGEIFIGRKYGFNSQVYVLVGIGSTEFGGDEWFTLNVGAGFRLLLTDWLAWHLDVRDHAFDRDLFGEDATTHNIEYNTGFTVFF